MPSLKSQRRSPLRIDPTRTITLRKGIIKEMRKRFVAIKFAVHKKLVEEDALGLIADLKSEREGLWAVNAFCPTGVGGGIDPSCSPNQDRASKLTAYRATTKELFSSIPSQAQGRIKANVSSIALASNSQDWRFHTDSEKVKLFQAWLRQQFTEQLRNKSVEDLWKRYVEEGFKKGAGRAFDDTTRAERVLSEVSKEKLDFYQGTKSEFLRSAFGRPESVEKVKLLAGRSFSDLEGITEEMSTRLTRLLTDGLVQGQHPLKIAKAISEDLDIGEARAQRIARTEIIRAHAEGQLQAFEALGVEELGVAVEWTTAGDNKVCPRCASLQGIIVRIDEAREKVPIPLHPDCRCAYLPAGVGEDARGQKRTKGQIDKALKKAGVDETVSKSRPESILNSGLERALIRFDWLVKGDRT